MQCKQPFICLTGAVLTCCILLCTCNNSNQKKFSDYSSILKQKADIISSDLLQLQAEIKKVVTYTESLYNNENISTPNSTAPKLFYNIEKETLYKVTDDGKSAIYATRLKKTDTEIYDIIRKTEPLDSAFKSIIEQHYPLAAQVYYLEKHSIIRMYPYSDLASQFRAGSDITSFNFYYSADKLHNKKKELVFISAPYADPAGRGWVNSLVAPVYNNSIMQGVIGIDITLRSITEKYFIPDTSEVILVDTSGSIIFCNKDISSILSLPKINGYKYLKPVEEDEYFPARFNVRKNRNKSIAHAFDEILIEGKTSSTCNVNSKKYTLLAECVPGFSWYLVKLIFSE